MKAVMSLILVALVTTIVTATIAVNPIAYAFETQGSSFDKGYSDACNVGASKPGHHTNEYWRGFNQGLHCHINIQMKP